MSLLAFVVTCEHACNDIPPAYSHLFVRAEADLAAHTGWDPGAWELAWKIAGTLQVVPFGTDYSRLLIEPNRSEGHPWLFSKYTGHLEREAKEYLLDTCYRPYRRKVEAAIRTLAAGGRQVLHLSVHTFTPVWNGTEREVEIGLLFDEARPAETRFCRNWSDTLREQDAGICVRPNEPYKGTDDGFTTYLRTKFRDENYLGIELEVSQKFVNSRFDSIGSLVATSLKSAITIYEDSRH